MLEILATLGQAGVTEIAGELGVHKSTVSRLIAVLESRGYVEQAIRTRQVPARVLDRPTGEGQQRTPRSGEAQPGRVRQPWLATSGETTNLAILDGDRIVNIVEAIGPEQITLRTWVGQSCPAHATSSGKVLLAGLEPADLRGRFAATLESFTAHTVAKLADLERELATVRERGWASVVEELEVGLNAVSAPVYDADSKVIAALSVSGPAYRLSPDRFPEIAKQTTAAADVISQRLGWVERQRSTRFVQS